MSDRIEGYAEVLYDDFISFAERLGVVAQITIEDITEVLELMDDDQLEAFMDDDFARGILMGSMMETQPAMEGDYDDESTGTTH